ncbi:MAG: PIN domain-containing protein [Thermotogae bacterium]|nr:PIN domain-containing protein [Thermotogota bacterium]
MLISIFKGKKDRLDASKRLILKAQKGEILIIVSSMMVFEILEGLEEIGLEFSDDYDIRQWEGFDLVSVDFNVARLGAKIKRSCSLKREQKVDAILLATAVYAKAQVFYTWDEKLIRALEKCSFSQLYDVEVKIPPKKRELF